MQAFSWQANSKNISPFFYLSLYCICSKTVIVQIFSFTGLLHGGGICDVHVQEVGFCFWHIKLELNDTAVPKLYGFYFISSCIFLSGFKFLKSSDF